MELKVVNRREEGIWFEQRFGMVAWMMETHTLSFSSIWMQPNGLLCQSMMPREFMWRKLSSTKNQSIKTIYYTKFPTYKLIYPSLLSLKSHKMCFKSWWRWHPSLRRKSNKKGKYECMCYILIIISNGIIIITLNHKYGTHKWNNHHSLYTTTKKDWILM